MKNPAEMQTLSSLYFAYSILSSLNCTNGKLERNETEPKSSIPAKSLLYAKNIVGYKFETSGKQSREKTRETFLHSSVNAFMSSNSPPPSPFLVFILVALLKYIRVPSTVYILYIIFAVGVL
jgi:hypothetical protein